MTFERVGAEIAGKRCSCGAWVWGTRSTHGRFVPHWRCSECDVVSTPRKQRCRHAMALGPGMRSAECDCQEPEPNGIDECEHCHKLVVLELAGGGLTTPSRQAAGLPPLKGG